MALTSPNAPAAALTALVPLGSAAEEDATELEASVPVEMRLSDLKPQPISLRNNLWNRNQVVVALTGSHVLLGAGSYG